MCNFIIRPIKSYATVDIVSLDETATVKHGDYIDVKQIQGGAVVGYLNGDDSVEVSVPLATFVHTFTANPKDIERVRKEEADKYPKEKSEKTDKK